jgi:hypothetical protein
VFMTHKCLKARTEIGSVLTVKNDFQGLGIHGVFWVCRGCCVGRHVHCTMPDTRRVQARGVLRVRPVSHNGALFL